MTDADQLTAITADATALLARIDALAFADHPRNGDLLYAGAALSGAIGSLHRAASADLIQVLPPEMVQ